MRTVNDVLCWQAVTFLSLIMDTRLPHIIESVVLKGQKMEQMRVKLQPAIGYEIRRSLHCRLQGLDIDLSGRNKKRNKTCVRKKLAENILQVSRTSGAEAQLP